VSERLTHDTEDGSTEYEKEEYASIWRDSSKPLIKFTNSTEFLNCSAIPTDGRGLYDKYINETDTTKLEKNDKGYYKTTWSYNDKKNKFTYQATYDDQYGWGVMRVPLKESAAEQKARLDKIDAKLDKILSVLENLKA
jgi:hypothetical protein